MRIRQGVFWLFLIDLEEALIEPVKALAIVHGKNARVKSLDMRGSISA